MQDYIIPPRKRPKDDNGYIENARVFQNLQKEYGSFRNFMKSIRRFSYPKRRGILAKTFRWIGPTGAFHFFWCVGEEVPEWEERKI